MTLCVVGQFFGDFFLSTLRDEAVRKRLGKLHQSKAILRHFSKIWFFYSAIILQTSYR